MFLCIWHGSSRPTKYCSPHAPARLREHHHGTAPPRWWPSNGFNSPIVRHPSGDVGGSGSRRDVGRDGRGLPHLPKRRLYLGAHRGCGADAVGVLFSASSTGRVGGLAWAASAFSLPNSPNRLCIVAALLERRMHRIDELSYSLFPSPSSWPARRAHSSSARFRDRHGVGAIVAAMCLRPACITATIGTLLVVIPAAYVVLVSAPYRPPPARVLGSVGGPAWRRVPDHPVAHRRRHGRRVRPWIDGGSPEALPAEPHTDFIYAVIGEELGLVGATATLVCFCSIAWRGLRISPRAQDSFGAFVALGMTTMIVVQAFVNMSACSD